MMTNADKIRSMSDGDLAACLTGLFINGINWFWDRSCDLCKAEYGGECPIPESDHCLTEGREILDWLKAEEEK